MLPVDPEGTHAQDLELEVRLLRVPGTQECTCLLLYLLQLSKQGG